MKSWVKMSKHGQCHDITDFALFVRNAQIPKIDKSGANKMIFHKLCVEFRIDLFEWWLAGDYFHDNFPQKFEYQKGFVIIECCLSLYARISEQYNSNINHSQQLRVGGWWTRGGLNNTCVICLRV